MKILFHIHSSRILTEVILTIEAEGSKFIYFFKKTIIMAIVCFFSTVHFLFLTIGALPVGFNHRVTEKKKCKNSETSIFLYMQQYELFRQKSIIHLHQKHPTKIHLYKFSIYIFEIVYKLLLINL